MQFSEVGILAQIIFEPFFTRYTRLFSLQHEETSVNRGFYVKCYTKNIFIGNSNQGSLKNFVLVG